MWNRRKILREIMEPGEEASAAGSKAPRSRRPPQGVEAQDRRVKKEEYELRAYAEKTVAVWPDLTPDQRRPTAEVLLVRT